jgi:hypothetical protein
MKKRISLLLVAVLLFAGALGGCKSKQKQKERTVYEITAEYVPAQSSLTGTVKVDFYNDSKVDLDVLKFELYPNAYRQGRLFSPIGYDVMAEAYYAGDSYGEIVVSSVLGGGNYEITGADKNVLSVRLVEPLAPEERITVDIGFSTRLAKINHRLGVTQSTVNFAGAFPVLCGLTDEGFYECVYSSIGDPFFADCADYSLSLTLPKEYALATTGKIVAENGLESKKKYTVSALNVRELAFSLSDSFALFEAYTGKTAVRYYAVQAEEGQELADFAAQIVAFYSSAFGECLYEELSLVETSIVNQSADHAGLCMFSSRLSGAERLWTVAKEIAAQWWYAAVGVNRAEYAWLVEGLSEYSAALFFDKYSGYGLSKSEWVDGARARYDEYKDSYRKALGWVDVRMNRPLSSFLNAYEYERIAVDRAALMLFELEKGIGSKKFLTGLRKYYAENSYGNATPAHLVGAYERIGLDLNGFFAAYLEGKGDF